MSTTESLCDQRGSFRCPVAESRRQCALRFDAETLPARLLDESAGGLSVLVDRLPNLEIEQTVLLQTDSGWFKVRVMYITESPPPEDGDAFYSEEPTRWIRLGLQRLGDAVPLDEPSVSPLAGGLRLRMRHWSQSNGWLSLSGVLLALATIFVPLGLMGVLWYAQRSEVGNAGPWKDPWASRTAPRPSDGRRPAEDLADGARPTLDSSAGRAEEPNAFGPRSEGCLQEMVRWLPGPTALGLPEVVRRLRLTEKQQGLIQQLIDAMAETMRKLDLDPRLRGAERRQIKQLRDKLLDDFLRRALDILTPEQRAEWEKLHDEPTAKQSPAL